MKVGIITIADFNNYGNRLQNYALQQAINTVGAEGVSYVPFKPNYYKYIIKTMVSKDQRSFLSKELDIKRLKNFLIFDNNFVHTVETREPRFSEAVGQECDYFIAGSDQVWNPAWAHYLYHNTFLRFTSTNKRISFSPSFGTDKIPKELEKKYKEGLEEFIALSVREEAGRGIIETLIHREADVLIDPTLLLTDKEWKKVSKKPKGVKNGETYILEYFLGDKSLEQKKQIEDIGRKYNCKLYSLLNKEQQDLYVVGPSEFVYLIENAKLILTDSFHACVFSFIFKKPFYVYSRNGMMGGMMSRIETLLDKFELQRKYAGSGLQNDLMECDYEIGYTKLVDEKNKAYDFLKKSLKIL